MTGTRTDVQGIITYIFYCCVFFLLSRFNLLFQQLVACSILTALLNEYSSSGRSSSVGLTWEFHSKCKSTFEVMLFHFLLKLFKVVCVSLMNENINNSRGCSISEDRIHRQGLSTS